MSNVRKLFSVNAIVFVSLFIGFLNNVAIGGVFGLSRAVDAYFAAGILGSMFMYLIVDYLGKNFLPIYSTSYHESPDNAARVASTVVTLLSLFAAAIAGIFVVFAEPIFNFLLPGFSDEDVLLTARMFGIQAPAIVLMTINNFHQYIWQHDEQYSRVAFARMFLPLMLLVFIGGGYYFDNVYALPMGFLAGHVVSAMILAYQLPYRFRPQLDLGHPDVRKILANSALLSATGLVARLRGPIQQYYASLLGEGAIAAMNIAFKLCRPIYDSSLMGVQMIVFSRSSRAVARGNMEKLGDIYDYAISAVLLLVMPIAVWIALNANTLIDVVFVRGEFTDAMATLTVLALLGAIGVIVFQGPVKLLSHSFYAMHRIWVPMVAMPLGTVIFFFATKYLSQSYGLFGLTLAQSLVAALTTIAMTLILSKMLPKFFALTVLRRLVVYFALALACGYAGLELAGIARMDGLATLMISLAVLLGGYAGALSIMREKIWLRALKSIRSATARRSA